MSNEAKKIQRAKKLKKMHNKRSNNNGSYSSKNHLSTLTLTNKHGKTVGVRTVTIQPEKD